MGATEITKNFFERVMDRKDDGTSSAVLVADSEDGRPLAQTMGPLRLVVSTDKHPTRWVRMVKAIKVVANP